MEIKEFSKKNYWVFLLIAIFLVSFYFRLIPGTKMEYPQLLEIDTHFFLRMAEYIIEHGELPAHDSLAGWGTIPGGPNRNLDFLVTLWIYPMMYFVLHPLFGVSMYWVAVWSPAFLGALQVLFMFFLAKELFNSNKVGLLAAAFLGCASGVLYRVSAGYIEKEPVAGMLMILGLYFFVKAFKEREIKKDARWSYLLTHPFSIIDKLKFDAEKTNTVRTIAYALTSGFFFAMMTGASGQIRIPMLMIGASLIVFLFLNRYSKNLIFAHAIMFITYLIGARVFAVAPPLTDVGNVLNFVVLGLMTMRYVTERFGLVKKEHLPYLIPVLVIGLVFATAVASYVLVDVGSWVSDITERVANPLTLGVIPSTVAESQGVGDFANGSLSNFGTGYAVSFYQWPSFIIYFSAIYFSLLGILLMCYEFVFKKRELEYVMVVVMYIMFMILAMGAARLEFHFSFPLAISAGYFLARGGSYVLAWGQKTLKGKRFQYLKIAGGIFIGVVIFTNYAGAWVMANNINGPLTEDFKQALTWLRDNTPEDAVLLEWWDYGWWYQYIAKKITIVDGGYHDRTPTQDVAKFYTEPLSENADPYSSLSFLKNYTVSYVMVSSDLIPKFGAMSKIANWGEKVDVLPTFNLAKNYQEGDKILLEYGGGDQTILVAYSVTSDGNNTAIKNITALVKMSQGQAYVRDIGIGNQIIRTNRSNSIPGMIYFAGNAVVFVPEAVEDCVFIRLFLFDGSGMEKYFEKVYDNLGIKIYKVKYENFPAGITGQYINTAER